MTCARLAVMLLALGLAACGTTPPTRYLMLAVSPGAATDQAGDGLVLRPAVVRWPAAFDRLEVARPIGEVGVKVESLARWSAAPAQLAATTLTADLMGRLPGAVVAPWSETATPEAVVVTAQVEALDERPSGYAMTAAVSVARGAVVRRWTFQADAPGAHDPEGEARAVSQLLGALAEQIARALASGVSAPPEVSNPSASHRPGP